MKSKLFTSKADIKIDGPEESFKSDPILPRWEIDADIDADLKREGLKLLMSGTSTRKIANFCGINIKHIKKL